MQIIRIICIKHSVLGGEHSVQQLGCWGRRLHPESQVSGFGTQLHSFQLPGPVDPRANRDGSSDMVPAMEDLFVEDLDSVSSPASIWSGPDHNQTSGEENQQMGEFSNSSSLYLLYTYKSKKYILLN